MSFNSALTPGGYLASILSNDSIFTDSTANDISLYTDFAEQNILLGTSKGADSCVRISSNTFVINKTMSVSNNFAIGTNLSLDRFTIGGPSNNIMFGPSIVALFDYDSNNPVYQQLNYAHDFIATTFDAYYDGEEWISSSSNGNFQIFKNSAQLQINSACNVEDGFDIQWNTALVVNSNSFVGIGTSNFYNRLTVSGPSNDVIGPHVAIFTDDDQTYPVYQQLNRSHDAIALNFDTFWNGSNYISSSLNGNFSLAKSNNVFSIYSACNEAIGSVIDEDMFPAFSVNSNSFVGIANTTPNYRVSISGDSFSTSGPHMAFFVYDDSNPTLNLINRSHDDISVGFDTYFDGSVWRASDANSYKISKETGKLTIVTSSNANIDDDLTLNTSIAVTVDSNSFVSLGTSNSSSRLTISGDDSSLYGPHVTYLTDIDNYPVYSQHNWTHDDISTEYDVYYDGSNYISSSSTGNFVITKKNGMYSVNSTCNNSPGSVVNLSTAIAVNNNSFVGIGTSNIVNRLTISGKDSSTSGPHVAFTTEIDAHPVYSQFNWSHDSVHTGYDVYYDGSNFISSSSNANYMMSKSNGQFIIYSSSNNVVGVVTALTPALTVTSNAYVGIGTSNATNRLTVKGTNSSTHGPHSAYYVYGDEYPVRQELNWKHDGISTGYDAYYNGSNWISSSSNANFVVSKSNGIFSYRVSSNIVQSNVIDNNLNVAFAINSNAFLGIGTSNFTNRVTVNGPDNSISGPHVSYYTSADSNPLFQQLNLQHGRIAMSFDAYYNGSDWISSSATGNFQIYKNFGQLIFYSASNNAPGCNLDVARTPAFVVNSNSFLGIGSTSITNRVTVTGPSNSIAGPHVAYFTADDSNYPVFQQVHLKHDKIFMNFDAYYDGSNFNSSSSNGNFQIVKKNGQLVIFSACNVPPMFPITPYVFPAVTINSNGYVGIGTSNQRSNLEVAGNVLLDSNLFVSGITTVSSNIVPLSNSQYDLGSSNAKFRDLYLSGSSIYLDSVALSVDSSQSTPQEGPGLRISDLTISPSLSNAQPGRLYCRDIVIGDPYQSPSNTFLISAGATGFTVTNNGGGSSQSTSYTQLGIFFITTSNIGVGTPSPTEYLDIASNLKVDNNAYVMSRFGVGTSNINSNHLARFYNSNSAAIVVQTSSNGMTIAVEGSNSQYSTSSVLGDTVISSAHGNLMFQASSNSAAFVVTSNNFVGVGTTISHAPLQFSSTPANRILVLNETANNDHQYHGFGVNSGLLRYQTPNVLNDHVFYAGISSNSSYELMRISGYGSLVVSSNITSSNSFCNLGQAYFASNVVMNNNITISNVLSNLGSSYFASNVVMNGVLSNTTAAVITANISNLFVNTALTSNSTVSQTFVTSNLVASNLFALISSNTSLYATTSTNSNLITCNVVVSGNALFQSNARIVNTVQVGSTFNSTLTTGIDMGTSGMTQQIALQNNGANNWYGFGASNGIMYGAGSSNGHVFFTGSMMGNIGTERMRLTPTGLGIGISNPSYKLQTYNGDIGVFNSTSTGAGTVYFGYTTSGPMAQIQSSNYNLDTVNSNASGDLIFYVRSNVVPGGCNALFLSESLRIQASNPSVVSTFNVIHSNVMSNLGTAYFGSNIIVNSNIGVGTVTPVVSLHISKSDAILVPVGTSIQRPTTSNVGFIRYNTDISQFEGFGAGANWSSLGGVTNVNQNTYIKPQLTTAGTEDVLVFVTSNSERMRITSNGSVGIGTSTPSNLLEINGNAVICSNMVVSNVLSNLGNAYFASNAVINSNLYISQNIVVSNILSNLGNAYFASNVTISNLTITGNQVSSGAVSYTGGGSFSSNVNIGSNLYVNQNVYVSNVSSNLGNAYFASNVFINSNLYVSGNTTNSNTLSNLGNAYFASNVAINGILTVSNVEYITSNITIYSSEIIQSNLTVQNVLSNIGNAYFASNVVVNSNLYVNQNVIFSNVLSNLGKAYFASNTSIQGSLGVGTTTAAYPLDVSGSIHTSGSFISDGGHFTVTNAGAMVLDIGCNNSLYIRVQTTNTNPPSTSPFTNIAIINSNLTFWYQPFQFNNYLLCASNVGILNFNPTYTLDVTGSMRTTSNTFLATSSGSVGIGTTTPQYTLDVYGTARVFNSNTASGPVLSLLQPSLTAGNFNQLFLGQSVSTYNMGYFQFNYNSSNSSSNSLSLSCFGGPVIYAGGTAVGINTSSPGITLDVNGKLGTTTNNSVAIPSLGVSGGIGDRIILFYGTASTYPYSIGINGFSLWNSVPLNGQFQWYTGGNIGMTLSNNLLGIGTSNPLKALTVFSAVAGNLIGIIQSSSNECSMSYSNNNSLWAAGIGCYGIGSNFGICSTNGINNNVMTLTQSGNVGIGTTTPQYMLDVSGSAQILARNYLKDAVSNSIMTYGHVLGDPSGDAHLYDSTNSRQVWGYFKSANKFTILQSGGGLVGIGTTSPTGKLSVTGSETSTAGQNAAIALLNTSSTSNNGWVLRAGAPGTQTPDNGFSIGDNYTYKMTFNAAGNIGIGTSTPAYTLDVNGHVNSSGAYVTTQGHFMTSNITMVLDTSPGTPIVFRQQASNFSVANAAAYFTQIASFGTSSSTINNSVYLATSSGSVGIGTSTPAYTLDVNGTTRCTGLTVTGSASASSVITGQMVAGQGYFLPTSQGNYLAWNRNNGVGAASFINHQGGGSGGWEWLAVGTSGIIGSGPVATLTNAGSLTVSGGITSAGSVGIGTTSPQYLLDVNGASRIYTTYFGSAGNSMLIGNQTQQASIGNNFALYQGTGGDTVLNAASGQPLEFKIGNIEYMRLTSNGNIGIGTTSPSYTLDISGTTRSTKYRFTNTNSYIQSILDISGAALDGIAVMNAASSNPSISALYTNGYVGIGKSNPGYTLDVTGDINFTGSLRSNGTIVTFGSGGGGGGASGFQFNGANLYSMCNVGIGLSNPSATLQVMGTFLVNQGYSTGGAQAKIYMGDTSTSIMGINGLGVAIQPYGTTLPFVVTQISGYVGIGTSNPQYTLDVNGSQRINSGNLSVFNSNMSLGTTNYGLSVGVNNTIANCAQISFTYVGSNSYSNYIGFGFNNISPLMSVLANGYVGIGTTTPAYNLDVSGTARAAALYANNYATPAAGVAGQGAYMMWNRNGGSGATTFANQLGGGNAGGWEWVSYNNTAAIVTPTPTMSLSPAGTLTTGTYLAYNPTLSNTFMNGVIWGKAGSTNNSGFVNFTHYGTDGAAANSMGMGVFGQSAQGQLTITGAGNVGINNTTPQYTLDVNGTTRCTGLTVTGSASASSVITGQMVAGQGYFLPTSQGNYLAWNRNNGVGAASFINHQGGGSGGWEWLAVGTSGIIGSGPVATLTNAGSLTISGGITSAGSVGIGTTTPAYNLDVAGSMRASNLNFPNQNAGTGIQWPSACILGTSASGQYFNGGNGSNDIAFRNTAGNIGIGTNPGTVATLTVCSNNNVGVLKPNPAYLLDVAGDINFTGNLRNNGTIVTGSAIASGFAFNGANLFTNCNVGIGTNAPSATLQVSGTFLVQPAGGYGAGVQAKIYMGDTNTSIMGINGLGVAIQPYGTTIPFVVTQISGYVGIGTSNPQYPLDVNGAIRSTGADGGYRSLYLVNSNIPQNVIIIGSNVNTNACGVMLYTSNYIGFSIYGQQNYQLTVAVNGIGINTSTPQYSLDVSGPIRSTSTIYANNIQGQSANQLTNDTLYFGNSIQTNFFLDRPAAGQQFAMGYNTPKAGTQSSILTVFNNSSDRLNLFSVQCAGSNSGVSAVVCGVPVGIGTSTPQYTIDVNGTARVSNLLVGAGTTLPGAQVSITSFFTTMSNANNQVFVGKASSTNNCGYMSYYHNGTDGSAQNSIGIGLFGQSAQGQMVINGQGYAGHNTVTPISFLTVAGDATGLYASDNSNGQLVLTGKTNTNLRLGFAIDTTCNVGKIQAALAFTGTLPLCLNAAGGNVGINTTTPGITLDINGKLGTTTNSSTGTPQLGLSGGTGDRLILFANSASTYPYSLGISPYTSWTSVPVGSQFQWYTGGNIGMTLSNNLLGVNTTTPIYTHDVYGTGRINTTSLNTASLTFTGQDLANANYNSNAGISLGLSYNATNNRQLTVFDSANGINSSNSAVRFVISGNQAVIDAVSTNGAVQKTLGLGNPAGVFVSASLGVGTSNPQRALEVVTAMRISGLSGAVLDLGSDFLTQIYRDNASNMIFTTAGANRVFIGSNGNVGINTTTPGITLDVNGKLGTTTYNSTAAPQLGISGGIGDRVILFPGTGSTYPYSIGITGSTLWNSVPSTAQFQWYTGGSVGMTLSNNLLGIGTGSPTNQLTLGGIAGASILINSNATGSSKRAAMGFGNTWEFGQDFAGVGGKNFYFYNGLTGGYPLYFESNNFVGINTTYPAYNLDVNGTCRHIGNSNTLATNSSDGGVGHNILLTNPAKSGASTYSMAIGVDYTSGNGYLNSAGNQVNTATCLQTRGGAVGVGTTAPAITLDVNGKLGTTINTSLGLPSVGVSGGGGDRVILYQGSTNQYPYSLGINGSTLWNSIPTGSQFIWYTGGSNSMSLNNGLLSMGQLSMYSNAPNFEMSGNGNGGTAVCYIGGGGAASGQAKTAIISQATGVGYCLANLHLCVNTANGSVNTSLTDARISISGNNGFVGIGNSNPLYPMHVVGSSTQSVTGGYYFAAGQGAITAYSTSTQAIGIFATSAILTQTNFLASSDRRIKNVLKHNYTELNLDAIDQIPVVSYEYIDKIGLGNNKKIGFVAQSVAKVEPDAVTKRTEIVPDIFKIAPVIDGNIIKLENHLNSVGTKIKLMVDEKDEKGIIVPVEKVIDCNTFVVTLDKNIVLNENVFVYGREVDDFQVLNYDHLFSLAFAGVQKLRCEMKEMQNKFDLLSQRLSRAGI